MAAVSNPSGSSPRRATGRRRGRRRRHGWRSRLFAGGVALVVIWILWAVLVLQFAPSGNTPLNRFDAIIVLGSPVDRDGNPTPIQLARVTEGVHEYERGVAPHLIVTGGAVANGYTEAKVMAHTAEAQGVPESAVLVEPHARDTIENACFATRIMKAHGWNSAEVVSSASHLQRAGIIFSKLPLAWRTHAAPALQPQSPTDDATMEIFETLKAMRYLVWASWREQCKL